MQEIGFNLCIGKISGGGNGTLFQYSCLENPMGRVAWWATAHGVAKSQTRLSMHWTICLSESSSSQHSYWGSIIPWDKGFPCKIKRLLSSFLMMHCSSPIYFNKFKYSFIFFSYFSYQSILPILQNYSIHLFSPWSSFLYSWLPAVLCKL